MIDDMHSDVMGRADLPSASPDLYDLFATLVNSTRNTQHAKLHGTA
jgi:hypothetical protein